MKKSTIAISLALSAVLLAVLTLPAVYADDEINDCKCNHYSIYAENTAYDEYTATGVTGHLSGGHFWKIDYIFQRGLGGYYQPAPPNVHLMEIHYEYFEDGLGYQYDFTWNYPVPWTYPVNPFGGDYPYYHCQTKNLPIYNVINGEYAGGKTSSWFQWPPYPYTYWYCSGSLAQVFAP
jgi:hypothetical protein